MEGVGYFFLLLFILLFIAFCIANLGIVTNILMILYFLGIIIAIGVGLSRGNR